MYYDILELLYNNKISLFNSKNLDDSITSELLTSIDNQKYIFELYNMLTDIFKNNTLIIKGGVIVQILLDEKTITGDLDIEIRLDDIIFDNIVKIYKHRDVTLNMIFPDIDEKLLISNMKNIMYKYLNNMPSNYNIDILNLVPVNSILENKIYISSAYKERYYVIYNIDNINIDKKIVYKINIIGNFILIRFYICIFFKCDNVVHTLYKSYNKKKYKSRFLFLDISLVRNNKYSVEKINKYNNNFYTYDYKNVLNNQIITLIYSYITKQKILKRTECFIKLFEKYKDTFVIQDTHSNIIYNDRIMFGRIDYIIHNNPLLDNYFLFRNLVNNNNFIYLLQHISFFSLYESILLSGNIGEYVTSSLFLLLNKIDKVISNVGGVSKITKIYDNNLLQQIIKLFNLTMKDIDDILHNKEERDKYVSLYYDVI